MKFFIDLILILILFEGAALMNALSKFLDDAVALGKLTQDYLLHDRFTGTNVVNIIQNWPHYGGIL